MVSIAPDISVVILCYRAKQFVPVFVAQMEAVLQEHGLSYELVLVANYHAGDDDPTPRIAHELAARNPRITVVAQPKEGMMGWDMRSGLKAAVGKTVAVIDGDGQMPPEDVVKVYDALTAGLYQMAKTYRVTRNDGMARKIVSTIYNSLLKILFPSVRVRDANSKPKIFRYEALHELTLTADRWFIDAEIIIQASQRGWLISEVPTIFKKNEQRPSFVTSKAMLGFVRDMVVYRLRTLVR